MLPEICICFAESDRPIAESIAARLERAADVGPWLAPSLDAVTETWDRGLGSAGILLLLSPDSVPPRLNREDWADLLEQVTPPVVSVLVRDCPVPPLMKRRRFFEWRDGAALRDLHRWAVSLHPVPDPAPFVPAPVPEITGASSDLWTALVDQRGAAQAESTDVAQAFAHAAAPWFRDVIWIACARRSPACLAGEITAAIGTVLDGPEAGAFDRSVELAMRHRVLLVLDGLEPDMGLPAVSEGSGSILITRRAEIPRAGSEPADQTLFEAMCVCVPGGFPLELPAAMCGLAMPEAVSAADRLVAASLVARLDRTGSRLRLRTRAHPRKVEGMRGRHAETLRTAFTRHAADPATCIRFIPEVELAIRWAVARDWGLAFQLTQSAVSFLRSLGRVAEAAFLLDIVLWAANDRGDKRAAESCEWELSWLRGGVEGGLRSNSSPNEQMGFEF